MSRSSTIALVAGAAVCLAAAIGLQIARDRLYAHEDRDTEQILYVQSGGALKRLTLDFDALAADVYWIRAIQHFGGDRQRGTKRRKYELLLSAARSHDHARSVLHDRLPVRRDLSERALPGRPGQRPIRRSPAEEGYRRAADEVAVPTTTSPSSTTGTFVISRRRPCGSSARPRCRTRPTGSHRSPPESSAPATIAPPPDSCGTRSCSPIRSG